MVPFGIARPYWIEDPAFDLGFHIRELTAGHTVRYAERDVGVTWPSRQLASYLVGEGPRTVEMGAEVANGVMCGGGVSPEIIAWVKERVAAGAARAERDTGCAANPIRGGPGPSFRLWRRPRRDAAMARSRAPRAIPLHLCQRGVGGGHHPGRVREGERGLSRGVQAGVCLTRRGVGVTSCDRDCRSHSSDWEAHDHICRPKTDPG